VVLVFGVIVGFRQIKRNHGSNAHPWKGYFTVVIAI
jgi:hypothetical protein